MKKIAILGASGQVGTETCLYLSKMKNISVIPICRTKFSSTFLELSGLECRIGNINQEHEAKELLNDCDIVADFTYLKGLPSEIKSMSKRIITNSIKHSLPSSKFIFISSVMAYGMGQNNPDFKSYIFARSVYGALKRYSEKLAIELGRKYKKEVYVLRLGEVHGEFQNVSRKLLNEIQDKSTFIPDKHSYTIFPYSIAEALVNIAYDKEHPDKYTLVSKPEWTWKEVHEYYCKKLNISPELILYNSQKQNNILTGLISRFISLYTELIASYLLICFPRLEKRLMALFYIRKAGIQIRESEESLKYSPYKNIHNGIILGKRLNNLSDTRKSKA